MKVTIGLPFFNPGDRFHYALKSIYAQTFVDWELILINDGSTDNSPEVAASLRDGRVRYIDDSLNLGLPARLNQIAREARGEVIMRMDSDDLMHPERLRLLIQALQANPGAQVVHSASISLDRYNRPIGRSRARTVPPSELEVFRTGGILHSTIAASRDWFLRNPYKEDYLRAEDRELFVRTYRQTRYAYVDKPLYYYFHLGNVRPGAYSLTYKTERRVIREYGRARLGFLRTKQLLYRSYCKSLLLHATSVLGIQNHIFRHQPTPLSYSEISEYEAALQCVKSQTLPIR
jgi:glycosyltransferase involved in cell wall biosynthesis